MKVYLAGSFAYQKSEITNERKFVLRQTADMIRTKRVGGVPTEVYVPCDLKIPNAWAYSMFEWGEQVYRHDLAELNSADVVILLSWGKENNAGAAWEAGYAVGIEKPVILVSVETDQPESLMLIHSSFAHLIGTDQLEYYLDTAEIVGKLFERKQANEIIES